MIKVLHINFSDEGGAAIASMDLHEELLNQGVHSRYLTLNQVNNHAPDKHYYSHRRIYTSFIQKIWYLYIKAYYVNYRNRKQLSIIDAQNDLISIPLTTYDLTKDPLYKEASIIHLHATSRFLDWPSFFRKNEKPIIWTLHDKNPFSGVLHCSTNFPLSGEKIEKYYLKKKKKWLSNSSVQVVSPSLEYMELSQKSKILGRFQHQLIHHGIPKKIFKPLNKNLLRKKHDIPLNSNIILSITSGIDRKLKGFEDLISFAADNPNTLFIIIGPYKKMQQLPNVIFKGVIKNRELLNEFYNIADATISFSKEESFGLTLAESLMAETIVISKNIGVIPEVISPNENGFIFEETSDIKLPIIAKDIKMSQKPKNIFCMKQAAEKYINLYSKAIK